MRYCFSYEDECIARFSYLYECTFKCTKRFKDTPIFVMTSVNIEINLNSYLAAATNLHWMSFVVSWRSSYFNDNVFFYQWKLDKNFFLWGVNFTWLSFIHILTKLLWSSEEEFILILPYPQMSQYQKKVFFFKKKKKSSFHSRNKS